MQIALLRFPGVVPAGQFNASSIAPPLSVACLAAYLLRRGLQVKVIDALGEKLDNFEPVPGRKDILSRGLSVDEIIARIPPGTGVIGVSCMFSSEWPFNREVVKSLKAAFPKASIIAGGEHATALPELVLDQAPEIDAVVLGEGEETFGELIAARAKGSPLGEIRGVAYRNNGAISRTPPRPRLTALDEMPFPAWDAVPIENYFNSSQSHGPYLGRTLPILASRGCPYACKFCSNPGMWSTHYAYRSPANVIDEIELYIGKYDIKCVEFYDLSPIIGKNWLHDFCALLLSRNVKIFWQMAAGTRFEALDENLLSLVQRAGCKYLGFAPESGSPEVLEEIGKKLNLPDFIRTVKLVRKCRIGIKTNFVIGFPKDTRRQIFKTLLFQLRLAFAGISDAPIFLFSPYPGSEYFSDLRRQKVIGDLDDDYLNSLGLNVSFKGRHGYCGNVGPRELFFYQLSGTLLFYAVHYLTHPMEVIKGIIFWNSSSSVLEQRVKKSINALLFGRHAKNRAVPAAK